ncbi:Uncharacterised protein [Mycobacterium tuberculosis]|nr:Uncharacterised protein [Mycobacterium tuberculosis]CKT40448.1 Uncharacterised protein [Mycobacterium tuberculosis]
MEQHHRTRLDLRHQHVPGCCRVGVVDPVERYNVPKDFGLPNLGRGLAYRIVGQSAGRAIQRRRAAGRRGDHIVGPGELAGDILGRNRGHIGVFPGMATDLHARVRDAPGAGGVGGHFVADQEEGGFGVVVGQDVQQPVGIGPRTVVEGQRDTLDDRTAQVLRPCDPAAKPAHHQHRTGDHDTGNRAPVAPGLVVGSLRHPGSLPASRHRIARAGPAQCDSVSARGRRTQRGPVISSSISVTSAAIGERSLRSKVMWANNG